MHTEDEAKKKFCPLKFASPPGGKGCVGQLCMAWVWAQTEHEYATIKPEGEGWEQTNNGHWRRQRGAARKGICGLANHGTNP